MKRQHQSADIRPFFKKRAKEDCGKCGRLFNPLYLVNFLSFNLESQSNVLWIHLLLSRTIFL